MTYEINDIIYTKDGRKSGNLTIVDKYPSDFSKIVIPEIKTNLEKKYPYIYTVVSDYGNILKITRGFPVDQYFATPGKADSSHKYYNYKEKYPEEFI